MILTGPEIERCHANGDILIVPFDRNELNPNSYNFRLSRRIVKVAATNDGRYSQEELEISTCGLELMPGCLYLGATYEKFGSNTYVMTLLGRSSVGRLGVFLNATADLGHVGTFINWTLEISVVKPVIVYPKMRIGQISFWAVEGAITPYTGRYQFDKAPQATKDPKLKGNWSS